jgi:hypothetical protein
MFARLDRKEIDRHFTYALTIVQANVHVRDLIEKASTGARNYRFLPLVYVFLENKVCFIISREWDGGTLLPGLLDSGPLICHMVPICSTAESVDPKPEHDRGSVALKCLVALILMVLAISPDRERRELWGSRTRC